MMNKAKASILNHNQKVAFKLNAKNIKFNLSNEIVIKVLKRSKKSHDVFHP